MAVANVKCPTCGMVLSAPEGCLGQVVRCGTCRCRFRVVHRPPASEEQIAAWLDQEADGDGVELRTVDARGVSTVSTVQAKARRVAKGPIRLVRLEQNAAVVEFPAKRLQETAFRSAMPRRCVQCGTYAHLHAHVILYTSQLADVLSAEQEHSVGTLELSEQQVRDLTDEQLLAMLPRVPNVPSPADLPMPYWLCRTCRGTAAISGQIQVNRVTGQGWCRLRMRNLEVASEFLAAAGGGETRGYALLRRRLETARVNPWDALPAAVRHRIEQWFKPADGEKFLAFVPSRDHAVAEDGMAGLLISNRRLMYHTESRHREVEAPASLELQLVVGSNRARLRIKTPRWEIKGFPVDQDGIKRLRRGLARSDFQGVWH